MNYRGITDCGTLCGGTPDDGPPIPRAARCMACGRFVARGEERIVFTLDSSFGPESIEVYCPPCDDRARATFRRIAGCERPC